MGMSPEDLEREYGGFFGGGEAEGDPEQPPEEPTEPEGEEQSGEEQLAGEQRQPELGYIELDGNRYRLEELAPYVNLHRWASSDPGRWRQLLDWAEGRAQIVPAGSQQPPSPQAAGGSTDSDQDWSDPDLLRAEMAAMRGGLERSLAAVASHAAEVAKERIKQRHGLDDQGIEGLMDFALQQRLVALANSQDPSNPYNVMERALEMAYKLATPAEQQERQVRKKVAAENGKRANWRGVGAGAGAPRPKEPPPPKDEREAFERMTAEIAAAMGQ